jgi:hypothetical protein
LTHFPPESLSREKPELAHGFDFIGQGRALFGLPEGDFDGLMFGLLLEGGLEGCDFVTQDNRGEDEQEEEQMLHEKMVSTFGIFSI